MVRRSERGEGGDELRCELVSVFGRVRGGNTFKGTVLAVVDRDENTESDDRAGEKEEETGAKERKELD